MKTLFPFVNLLSALPVLAAEPPQSPQPNRSGQDSFHVSVKTSNNCIVLSNKDCDGKNNVLRFETPSGYFISVEKINDQAHAVPFDQTYELKPVGNLHGYVGWDEHITGTVGRFGKAFRLTEQSQLNIEAYVGNISGAVNLNAKAEGTLYPQKISIPAFSFHAGDKKISFPGQTYSYAGGHKTLSHYNYASEVKSYYGGLKESFGTSFGPLKNTHVLVNQFAQVGLERIGYGAGVGLAYTSNDDQKIGQRASNICQGGDFRSSARYAFVISACADKTKMNLIYDKLLKNAEPVAARGNERLSNAQAFINKVEKKTGYGYTLPTYTGKDVLNGLGISSPYDHVNTSFVAAASLNMSGVTLTLTRHQPLKPSRDGGGTTSFMLGKEF